MYDTVLFLLTPGGFFPIWVYFNSSIVSFIYRGIYHDVDMGGKAGDSLILLELRPIQHFTEPPPRFSEGTIVSLLYLIRCFSWMMICLFYVLSIYTFFTILTKYWKNIWSCEQYLIIISHLCSIQISIKIDRSTSLLRWDSQQVKKLEELGIGRPSTYAPTLRTLQVHTSFHADSTLELFWAVPIHYN